MNTYTPKTISKLSSKVCRLLLYALPDQTPLAEPAEDDELAPDPRNSYEKPFRVYVKLQTGVEFDGPWRRDLRVIQRREKFYYALFPGLLTGNVTASATLEAEHAALATCLDYLRHPSRMQVDADRPVNDIEPLSAAQRDPSGTNFQHNADSPGEAKTIEKKNKVVGPPFRFDKEVLIYEGVTYLSYKALSTLGAPLNFDANTIHGKQDLCRNDTLYNMLRRTIRFVHQRLPREQVFRLPDDKRLVARGPKPLSARPLVDGHRSRGASWSAAEDEQLRDLFGQDRRNGRKAELKQEKDEHYAKMRKAIAEDALPPPPFDARAARAALEEDSWAHAVKQLPQRTRGSIRARLKTLNDATRNKYIFNGKMRADCVDLYRKEYLGLYNTMPRFRPSGFSVRPTRVKRSPDDAPQDPPVEILPWREDDDNGVIEVFVQHAGKAERHQAALVHFRGFRTDEDVLERAWALKKQGYLPNTDLPVLTRGRGRPNRSLRATRSQPSAIPRPAQHQTVAS